MVYKIKKPVKFEFLDFSSLSKREHYCNEEVRLNERLTRNVYYGVVPIFELNGILNFDKGNIVEFAVKMRRLDENGFLDNLINKPDFERKILDEAVKKLTRFYQSSDTNIQKIPAESFKTIDATIKENIKIRGPFIGQYLSNHSADFIKTYQLGFLRENKARIMSRIEQELVIDGHGDLKLEHFHYQDGVLNIYDCIEFNPRIREVDLLSDIGFMLMDLDLNRHHEDVEYLKQQFADRLKGYDPEILDFYMCHRALVVGMIKHLKSEEDEVPHSDREEAKEKSKKQYSLALRYATAGSQPTIFIIFGRIASGKSKLARWLSKELLLDHLNSDVIRKQMIERDTLTKDDLYSEDQKIKNYQILIDDCLNIASAKGAVVCDATFSSLNYLDILKQKISNKNINLIFVETFADDKEIKRRLKARENKKNIASDARLQDFEKLKDNLSVKDIKGLGKAISIHTNGPFEETINQFFDQMHSLMKA